MYSVSTPAQGVSQESAFIKTDKKLSVLFARNFASLSSLRSPPSLLEQIVLVDDASTPEAPHLQVGIGIVWLGLVCFCLIGSVYFIDIYIFF